MTTPISGTTGIGSLPHLQLDAALEYAFRHSIPFVPQLPRRSPREFMLPQALDGLPGLAFDDAGMVRLEKLDTPASAEALRALERRLEQALSGAPESEAALAAFEPDAEACLAWQPFCYELEERVKRAGGSPGSPATPRAAKAQLAGPVTVFQALRVPGESRLAPELHRTIERLLLARGTAMIRRLRATGVQPLLFIDEPGLYRARDWEPLATLLTTLKRENATIGLHCCAETDWTALLSLPRAALPDLLSIDLALSLPSLLSASHMPALERYFDGGGRLALGIVPTGKAATPESLTSEDLRERFGRLQAALSTGLRHRSEQTRRILANALYTPACGLALHSIADAEAIAESLNEFYHAAITPLRRT